MNVRDWTYPQLYHLLGVHPEASAEEIEAAYMQLCDQYRDSPERQHALGVAWAVLGDRERRRLYDRRAIAASGSRTADAVRPLVTWATVFVSAAAVLMAFGTRDIASLMLVSYVAASTPWGRRAIFRARRWLGMRGWLSWAYGMSISPVVGTVAAPVDLVRSAVALIRLWRDRDRSARQ